MSESQSVQRFLAQAKEKEKKYDWLDAVELHQKALNQVLKQRNFWKAGEIRERMSNCFHRAAMQAADAIEFSKRMRLAVANCEKARALFERVNDPGKIPRILRADAMIAYLGFWLTSDVSEKKRLLSDCCKLTEQSLDSFKEAGDALEYGKTYNNLSSSAFFRYTLEWNFQVSKNLTEEALVHGEQAITLLSSINETYELARAYAKTSIYRSSFGWHFVSDMDERETCLQGAQDYWRKAVELSEEASFLELSNISGVMFDEINWTFDEMIANYGRALDYSRKAGDKYLIGTSFEALAYASLWKGIGTDNPDRRVEILQRSLHYAEEAKHQFSSISFSSPRGIAFWTEAPYAEYNWIAASFETNISKRRDLLKSAAMYATDAIRLGERTGYPGIISSVHHNLSKVLDSLAQIENNTEEKMRILKKALAHRKRAFKIFKQIFPFNYWGIGLGRKLLADLKIELSKFEKTPFKRKKMLREAVSDQEMGLQLVVKEALHWEKRGECSLFTSLGRNQYSHGESLVRFYDLTKKNEHLVEAVRAFEDAAKSYNKLYMAGPMAECYWKAAQTYDSLGEYLKAAESFESASESYGIASKKIPQLASFYSEHESYMIAWSDIEKSRHELENENHSKAREYYHACSRRLEMTKKWSYLSSYYFALSNLEHGEALSRLDKPQYAIKAFDQAIQTFEDSANSLLKKVERLETPDERDEAFKLAKTAGLRKQYCMGRVLMEAAVIFNIKGDRISSAKKYSSAAEVFKEIAPNFDREETQKDLQFAAVICGALEQMELAEERCDAAFYKRAANLFTKASEISHRKIAKLTAMGKSCFCQALEMGMKFVTTSNTNFYSAAKLCMENATGYFQRAGSEKLTLYVEAIKKHFDAYLYVRNAEAETEPEKRAKLYLMAEKCLELSAEFYRKAGYRAKRKEVLQNLGRVRKQRQFAFSLGEVATASAALFNANRLSMLDLAEKAVGLNNFESVNIRASVSVPREFVPTNEFEVKLDLVNVGKSPGLLVRIEGLIPPRCRVLRVPSSYMLEDDSLNMKGKRLEPLSVESFSIWVQITDTVDIHLSPCVVYVDEIGNFRKTKIEEIAIKPIVEFESKAAQVIFNYLVNAFVDDRVKYRLDVDGSGWRSFPQVIKGAAVSKRSLYGAGGALGHAMSGLQRKGLINLETIVGARGRGGHILRVRIHHKNESVRRYVREKAPNLLT